MSKPHPNATSTARQSPAIKVRAPFEALAAKGFNISFQAHAKSILYGEFPQALDEIGAVLNAIELPITEMNGVVPTPKQRANILKRADRKKEPVPFAEAWTDNFVSNKFGQATTHWEKLIHRVERGVGNPCPLLLIGLPASIVVFDEAKVEQQAEEDLKADGDEP